MSDDYPHKSLADLKKALDRGVYKDRHIEVTIDNDSVHVKAWPLDENGKPYFGDDDLEDWPEPEYLINLGDGNPRQALKEALDLLGIPNVGFA